MNQPISKNQIAIVEPPIYTPDSVRGHLDMMAGEICELEVSIQGIGEKLNPILAPSTPEACADGNAPTGYICAIARDVANYRTRIVLAKESLRQIAERIAL